MAKLCRAIDTLDTAISNENGNWNKVNESCDALGVQIGVVVKEVAGKRGQDGKAGEDREVDQRPGTPPHSHDGKEGEQHRHL
jgi:hypothetical protein